MKKDITYYELIRTVHDKVPPYISFLLMVKLDFTDSVMFYIVSYFLRFNGLLILCGNFQLSKSDAEEKEAISDYLRYFTCHFLLSSAKITNLVYIIISLLILFLFCLRMSFYFNVISKLSRKANLKKIKLSKYQIFMDHIVFLFYPYLIEFLSQIYISYIFPTNYIFQRDQSKIVNIVILLINTLLIIAYNINNYYYLHIINRPLSDKNVPVKYRYSRKKFYSIFLLHNVIIIQSIEFYFATDEQLKIYTYVTFCIFALIFIALFFTSLNNFNYEVTTNHFVSIMSGFCFFSIISEGIVRILGYEIKTTYALFIFNICKVVVSCCFQYFNVNMSNSKLLKLAKTELFKLNKGVITDDYIYDVFLYIFDVLKDIKKEKNDVSSIKLLNTIYEHQNTCISNNCKCRLIQILPHGKEYSHNFTENLIERIGFLIESAFAQTDFSDDYDLCLILCEHFFSFKDNPIMAYSLLQTLLYFNLNNLSMEQLLILYETCQKYIEVSLSIEQHHIFVNKYSNTHNIDEIQKENMVSLNVLKEKKFRETYLIYSQVNHIQSMMINYCKIVLKIIKQKNITEDTVKIKKSDYSNEVNSIDFQYLSNKVIEELISMLKDETKLHKKVYEEIADLKTSKLPIEFYYKCFSFFEVFYEGMIKEELLPTFYSFTNDHNLYSTTINPNIFFILKQRFIDLNMIGNSSHYCIFKYCQGMTITYFSEPLSQELGYYEEELINNNIDILFPNDYIKPHHNLLLKYLITEQNRVFPTINNCVFNKKRMSINSFMVGASLPGLGKNLLIIVSIELRENDNDFYFFYNSNLELISLSNNNHTILNLDLDLVTTCKLNLLAIYGIDENILKQKINSFIPKLNDFKYNLDIMSEEFFTKKLFTQSSKNKASKFKLIKEIENHQTDQTEEGNNESKKHTLTAQKSLEKIYNNKHKKKLILPNLKFRIVKQIVIKNMNKYLNENENIDYDDKTFNKISDCFTRFQGAEKLSDKNLLDYKTTNNIFDITVKFNILYDTPFVTIKIHEQINYDLIGKNNRKLLTQKDFLLRKETKNSAMLSLNQEDRNNYTTHTFATTKKTVTSAKSLTVSSKFTMKMQNIQNKFKSNKTKCEKYIKEIIIIFNLCIFLIYIIILIYQLNIISNLKTIFLAFYYNYIQRDKLVNLYSVLISGYFYHVNLVDYSEYMSISEYNDYIIEMAQAYSSSFHTFYQHYIKYRFLLGKDLSTLYQSFNVSKVRISWIIETTTSNYMNEAENMVHISTISSKNDNSTDILYDATNFFNSHFRDLKGEYLKIKTKYIQILFYMCANYKNVYSELFSQLQNEINDGYTTYEGSTRKIYIFIESLGIATNISLIIIAVYFLMQTNKVIFRNIANLFIDFTQEGEYSFKNNKDNHVIIEKLIQIQFLFCNFSLKAISKYNKRLDYNTIDLSEDVTNTSFITSESNFDNKNKITSRNKNKTPRKINELNKGIKSENNTSIENNKSTTFINSKTNSKLLNDQSVNLVAKLNQKNEKLKGINTTSKNFLLSNSNSTLSKDTSKNIVNNSNINMIKKDLNNKDKEDNGDIITIDTIIEKLEIKDLKIIKKYLWVLFSILICVIIFFFVKIIITTKNLNNYKQLFLAYSIVTFDYSMVLDYFNNLELLFINQELGRPEILSTMTDDVEAQNRKSEKIKSENLIHYRKVYNLFEALNRDQEDTSITNFEDILCETDLYCRKVLNSKYSIVSNGIDVAMKSIIQEINNYFIDYLRVKNNIISFENISYYFIDIKYRQIDMSLNFLLSLVEDRSAEAFLIESDNLIRNFKSTIVIFDVVIVVFVFISAIILAFIIVKNLLGLLELIEKSTTRINKSTCYIKIKNLGISNF